MRGLAETFGQSPRGLVEKVGLGELGVVHSAGGEGRAEKGHRHRVSHRRLFTGAGACRPLDARPHLRQMSGMARKPANDELAGRRQTLAAVIVVAILLIGGWWLMNELQHHRDVGDCIASGRRDCVPVAPDK